MKDRRTRKILQALTLIAFSAPAWVGQTKVDTPSQEIERHVAGVSLSQVTIVNAATGALNPARVPAGIATSSTCGSENFLNLSPAGPRLRDLFDSIEVADPRYHLTLDQEVMNLTPVQSEPTLLDVVIPSFDVEGEPTVDWIVEQLLNTSALQKAAVELKLQRGYAEIGLRSLERPGYPKPAGKVFDVHLRNVTLRAALNRVARAHGTAVWHYDQKQCKNAHEFTLKFLVW